MPDNPLLFNRSLEPFSTASFHSPSNEYRGAPFWSWNTKLSTPRLLEQLRFMKDSMGMGGAHMHPRTGLDTEYMGEEYLDIMRQCIEFCRDNDMLACLYDEDRWPSGAAGGVVSKKNPEYRQMHLLVTRYPYGELPEELKVKNPPKGLTQRSENGRLIARFNVHLSSGLATYSRLAESDPSGPDTVWFYSEHQPPEPWWNYGTYVDALNPDAIKLFLDITHEKYRERFGADFGSVIPSIFTDEPQFTGKEFLEHSGVRKDLFLPWTGDLGDSYEKAYGESLLDHLPELVWDAEDVSLTRYRYHDHLATRFVSSFIDQISKWCRSNNLNLTGHVNGEPRLTTQTQSLGEAMRCYQNLDIPGIDMLCDGREYNTVKQAVSVARQRGVRGVLCEIYGVTNWTFDFTGHKGQGDWQAALGVTFRVPHLFPASIAGESKRDYPAAIGPQSPWTTEYAYIESHFARVNSVLTRGRPICRVAVIHPIESFWLSWGPADRNGDEQVWREHAFEQLSEWLLHGLVDFDFVSESLFPDQCALEDIGETLPVGEMRYDVVIVPNLRTIRSTTVERLQRFEERGGKLLVSGGLPTLVDVKPASLDFGTPVGFTEWDILGALEHHRDVRVLYRGVNTQSLFYQLRQDGEDRFLFVCDTERWDSVAGIVQIKGAWDCTVLDTLEGTTWGLTTEVDDGWTSFSWTFQSASSLLVRLSPRKEAAPKAMSQAQPDYEEGFNQLAPVTLDRVTLSEPNVLLLDYARWRLASSPDGAWEPKEEILRIDNLVRARLGMPQKKDAFPQPWNFSAEERAPRDTVHLEFTFESASATPLGGCKLALENLGQGAVVYLDEDEVRGDKDGWWVDQDIPTLPLPALGKGTHTLKIELGVGLLTPIERVYVLGDFYVHLYGANALLDTPRTERLSWGDYTRQGLPFYAGNVTYHAHFDVGSDESRRMVLQTYQLFGPAATLTHYPPGSSRDAPVRAAITSGSGSDAAHANGDAPGGTKYHLSLPPHLADLGIVAPGRHEVEITLFGNRQNAFGAMHMPRGATDWWNPNSFRGEQHFWTDEYNVEEMGMSAVVQRVEGTRALSVPIRRRHVEQAGYYGHGR